MFADTISVLPRECCWGFARASCHEPCPPSPTRLLITWISRLGQAQHVHLCFLFSYTCQLDHFGPRLASQRAAKQLVCNISRASSTQLLTLASSELLQTRVAQNHAPQAGTEPKVSTYRGPHGVRRLFAVAHHVPTVQPLRNSLRFANVYRKIPWAIIFGPAPWHVAVSKQMHYEESLHLL